MSALKLGLLASTLGVALWACYGSSQVKDGQSHWLERCSEASDCEDERICACGVCTIACVEAEVCGARALCANVELSQCDEPSAAPERVCLSDCSEDADCDRPGILCRMGACVSVEELEGDGGSPGDGPAVVIDLDLGGGLGETLGVRQFLLHDQAVIWVTEVADEEDGYLFSMDLESTEITLLARPPTSDLSYRLEAHGDLLIYGAEGDARALFLSDPTDTWSPNGSNSSPIIWATDSTSFYYALRPDARQYELWRAGLYESAQHEVVYTSADATIRSITLDAEHVYVEELPDTTPSRTWVRRLTKTGSNTNAFSTSFREPRGYLTIPLAFFVHDGTLISDLAEHRGIQAHALSNGAQRTLTQSTIAIAAASSAADGYVYFTESTSPAASSEQFYVSRVSLSSGESERLRATASFASQVAVAEGFLYWIEQGRLVRMPLSAVTD